MSYGSFMRYECFNCGKGSDDCVDLHGEKACKYCMSTNIMDKEEGEEWKKGAV